MKLLRTVLLIISRQFSSISQKQPVGCVKVFPDSSAKKERLDRKGGGHSVSDQQKHRNPMRRHAWLR